MAIATIWTVGYVVAGVFFVWRDHGRPIWNFPSDVRSERRLWAICFLWPLAISEMRSGHPGRDPTELRTFMRAQALPTLAIYLAIGVVGSAMVSI